MWGKQWPSIYFAFSVALHREIAMFFFFEGDFIVSVSKSLTWSVLKDKTLIAMSNWHVAKEWFKEGRIRFFFNFGFRFKVNFNVLKVFTDLIPSVYII